MLIDKVLIDMIFLLNLVIVIEYILRLVLRFKNCKFRFCLRKVRISFM